MQSYEKDAPSAASLVGLQTPPAERGVSLEVQSNTLEPGSF